MQQSTPIPVRKTEPSSQPSQPSQPSQQQDSQPHKRKENEATVQKRTSLSDTEDLQDDSDAQMQKSQMLLRWQNSKAQREDDDVKKPKDTQEINQSPRKDSTSTALGDYLEKNVQENSHVKISHPPQVCKK